MSRKIICITGFEGSGKDTVASILEKQYQFKRLSFADNLKKALCVIFGWKFELIQGLTKESRIWREQVDPFWAEELGQPDFTPRKALQMVGTNLFRNQLHPDIWIKSLKKEIIQTPGHIVIVDGRFPNEIEAIKEMGGYCIRVTRFDPDWMPRYDELKKEVQVMHATLCHNLEIDDDQSEENLSKYIIDMLYTRYKIHPCETSLLHFNDYDYNIDNTTTLHNLINNVHQMMTIIE